MGINTQILLVFQLPLLFKELFFKMETRLVGHLNMVDNVFLEKNLISSDCTINTVNLVAECVIVFKCCRFIIFVPANILVFFSFILLIFNIDQRPKSAQATKSLLIYQG